MLRIGVGLQTYACDLGGRVPRSIVADEHDQTWGREEDHDASPGDTLIVRREVETREGLVARWDGVGSLFREGYVTSPEVFYCPAHTGEHPFSRYEDVFGVYTGEIVIIYQFRAEAAGQRLGFAGPSYTLLANGLRTRSDYSHVVGNNMLKSDGSVTWFDDPQRTIYSSLPEFITAEKDEEDTSVPDAFDEMDRRELKPTDDMNPQQNGMRK